MKRIIFKKEDLTQLPIPEVGYKTLGMDLDGTLSYIDDLGDITPIIGTNSGGITNLVDDTTPELGGNLDVQSNEIISTSPNDIKLNSSEDIVLELGDFNGDNKVSILNSNSLEVASIDSYGNISTTGTINGRDLSTDGLKLDNIESGADVTDSTNVDAAGAVMNTDVTTASMSFVIDEDNMISNSDTKIPTQQSVKAYVDNSLSNVNLAHFAAVYDSTSLLTALADSNIETILVADNILISTATSLTINSNNTKLIFGNQIEFRSTGLPWDTVNITWNDTTVTDDTLIKSEIFFSTISSFIVNNSQGFNMKNVLTSDNISFVKNTGQDIKYEKGNLISGDAIKEYWDNTFVISDGSGSGLDADLLDGQQGSYYLNTSTIIDEDNMISNSDTKIPTQQSVKAYVDNRVASSVTYQGGYSATTSPNSSALKGYMYTVTVAGSGSGYWSSSLEIGDVIIAEIDNPSSQTDWTVVNKDLNAASIKTSYESNSDTNAFTDAEKTKLAGIEANATADQTASEILTAIKTVDGTGSGLDADLLDGQEGSFYQAASTAITKTSAVFSKTITIESPTASEDITVFRTDVAITVQEVIAVSNGTSPSTTYVLRHSTDRNAVGNLLTTSGTTTSTTTGNIATLSDNTIPVDSWIWLETTAASGTNVKLTIDIRYTID